MANDNSIKFKVYGKGYEKLSTTNPSGISYTLGYCLPIFDPNFDLINGGTNDVSADDFLSETTTHNAWWEQYETMSGEDVALFDGQKIWLAGGFDGNGAYVRSDKYEVDGNLLNVIGNLDNQNREALLITTTDLWKVHPYTPLKAQGTNGNVSAGTYEAMINGDAGDFVFNKMAIFIKEIDAEGNNTGTIHFFGMVYSNISLLKRYNDDPEAYNPSFKIKLNVVVADYTSTDPIDDYVFINDGYWYALSNDVMSSMYGSVSRQGDTDLLNAYEKAGHSNYRRANSSWANSQIITQDKDNTTQAYAHRSILMDYNDPNNAIVHFLSDYKVLSETTESAFDKLNIVYGRTSQAIFGKRNFVFETWAGDGSTTTNRILDIGITSPIGNWTPSCSFNFVFGDGQVIRGDKNIIFGIGTIDDGTESATYGDNCFVNGDLNQIGSYTNVYSDFDNGTYDFYNKCDNTRIQGHDNKAYGVFTDIMGSCNEISRQGLRAYGHENLIGVFTDTGRVYNFGSLSVGSDWLAYNINENIFGNQNLINHQDLWHSEYRGYWYEDINDLKWRYITSNINILGNHNQLLGNFANIDINGYIVSMNTTKEYGDTYRPLPSTYSSIIGHRAYSEHLNLSNIVASSSDVKRATLSSVNAENSSVVESHHSDVTISYSSIKSNFSNVNSYYVGGYGGGLSARLNGRPAIARNSDGSVGATTIPEMNSLPILNGKGGSENNGYMGVYKTSTYSVYMGITQHTLHHYDTIADVMLSNWNSGSIYNSPRSDCPIYHLDPTTEDVFVGGNYDGDVDTKILPVVWVKQGTFANNLLTNFTNGSDWYIYLVVTSSTNNYSNRGDLFRIESVTSYNVDSVDYLKIEYSHHKTRKQNQDNESSSQSASGDVVDGFIPHFIYGSDENINKSRIQTDMVAFVEKTSSVKDKTFFALESSRFVAKCTAYTETNWCDVTTDVRSSNLVAYVSTLGNIRNSNVVSEFSHLSNFTGGSYIGSGGKVYANHIGSDIISSPDYQVQYLFKLDGNPLSAYVEPKRSIAGDYDENSWYHKHRRWFGDGKHDSMFDFVRGKVNVDLALDGHTAFNFMYGNEIYVGKDMIDDIAGSTGTMYNFLFGYDIQVLSNSGYSNGANFNIFGAGVGLLISRTDQVVFGRLNTGDTRNSFEFGIGLGMYSGSTYKRQNGFAFGHLIGGEEWLDADYNSTLVAKYPAFKIETGWLYLGYEKQAVVVRSFEAYIPSASYNIEAGDLVWWSPDPSNITTVGDGYDIVDDAGHDFHKVYVRKMFQPTTNTSEDDWRGNTEWAYPMGIALNGQSQNGGEVMVAISGGSFKVTRYTTEKAINVPSNFKILASKQLTLAYVYQIMLT